MLLFVSDLHLTDGRGSSTLSPGAFEMFAERIGDLALRASWRADGRYRPLDRLDVVLLGDVLDLIRSKRWVESAVRPWHDVQTPGVVQCVGQIVDDVLHHNQAGLDVLRALAAPNGLVLPSASHAGEPVWNAPGHPVELRIHYLVGNHDWPLHLPGPEYSAIRQRVAGQLGLAQSPSVPFPHDPLESAELVELLRRHRTWARHGDIFDPINFSEDRCASSLGDAIVVELVNRFVARLETELADDLPAPVVSGIREIDHIRPLLFAPAWIEGMLDRSCPSAALRKAVKRLWDELADEFLQLGMVRERDTMHPLDLVDGLAAALKFSRRVSVGWTSRIATWLHGLRGTQSDSYASHAISEQDFRNRRARHIVYGHTHQPETVALDASYADGFVLNQTYLNTGTWRRSYRATQFAPSEHEFIATDQMTYVSIYQGDERSGRPLEVWTGTLGVSGVEQMVARIDSGREEYAVDQPLPTSRVPLRAPHFLRPVGTGPRRPTARR